MKSVTECVIGKKFMCSEKSRIECDAGETRHKLLSRLVFFTCVLIKIIFNRIYILSRSKRKVYYVKP